jgi:hypothetical protein
MTQHSRVETVLLIGIRLLGNFLDFERGSGKVPQSAAVVKPKSK